MRWWPVVLICCVILFCINVVRAEGVAEKSLRLIGVACQLGGFIFTLALLNGTKKKFKPKTLFEIFVNILKGFPKIILCPSVLSGSGACKIPPMKACGYMLSFQSVEEKIAWIEGEVISLRAIMDKGFYDVKGDIEVVRQAINENIARIRNEIEQCKELVKSSQIDGIYVSYFGVLLFVIGSILSSIPDYVLDLWGKWLEVRVLYLQTS